MAELTGWFIVNVSGWPGDEGCHPSLNYPGHYIYHTVLQVTTLTLSDSKISRMIKHRYPKILFARIWHFE